MFEIPMPAGLIPKNFNQPEPIKVGPASFLIPVYANGAQRVILWEWGAATSKDVTPAIATSARGALYAGDNGVWLVSWQDMPSGAPKLIWQQVGTFTPYRSDGLTERYQAALERLCAFLGLT